MTKCKFIKKGRYFMSAEISGHSGADEYGYDIVCSAVSASTQLVANAVSEVFKITGAHIETGDGASVCIALDGVSNENQLITGSKLIESLYLQLTIMENDYSKYLKVNITEV